MNNFFQSWAFWFLLGCFVVAVIAFILWVICAAGSKRSRVEEKLVYEAYERERMRRDEDSSLDDQFTKLLEEAKRLGVGEKEFIDNVSKRYKRVPETEIATQNNPRTD